jgi:hypothetical protein
MKQLWGWLFGGGLVQLRNLCETLFCKIFVYINQWITSANSLKNGVLQTFPNADHNRRAKTERSGAFARPS